MSSRTQPEDHGSSTNPFSSSSFEARFPATECEPAVAVATTHDDADPASHSPDFLCMPVAIQDLSVNEIPVTGTRVVVSLGGAISSIMDSGEAIVPFRFRQQPRELLAIVQSFKSAWFSPTIGSLQCTCYYDPASDDVVLHNLSQVPMQIAPIEDDNKSSENERSTLNFRDTRLLSPGPWRIFSANSQSQVLADLFLLRRPFDLAKHTQKSRAAASKRKNTRSSEAPTKRQRIEARNSVQGRTLINNPFQSQTEEAKLQLCSSGNPLLNLRPGQSLVVRPAAGRPTKTPKVRSLKTFVQHRSEALNGSDSYSLRHTRDLAAHKGFASVFSARHAVFGNIVVKVIRTKQVPQHSYIPIIARNWKNEEQLLRRVSHPSIIKFYESDARLFSIYMEYLPTPDLNGMRHRHDNYFSGTDKDADRILCDMASALQYLFGERIQHNDIKPGNILYGSERGAVLIDFGLGAVHGSQTCTGGTPWYVPREFYTQSERGPKSDVYALGVVMLYVLRKSPLPDVTETGWIISKVPEDSSQAAIMQSWLRKVEAIRDKLSGSETEKLVSGMLHPSQDERLSTKRLMEVLPIRRLDGQDTSLSCSEKGQERDRPMMRRTSSIRGL
ncbi:uncharacterized protein FMAN_14214 [Fusarium mangiferae]|uniref:Protein kinase domain-containing protein n=1 Tax=Fusarium mangiferae TaxID=192010 RepID=A0A1L7UG01_FUSMA|nr:uncharacterized protein FMAN_14214 [Fusarium mangiferae]CVL08122.1 uncharacterized protein FMAN_14214 [Fusarium mangiferae]